MATNVVTKTRVFIRYDVRIFIVRTREDLCFRVARLLPRWMRYWVIINEAVQVANENPEQEVPSITWDQMVKRLEV